MSLTHWRYVAIDNGLVAAVGNFLINGAIAWVLFRPYPEVPLWGPVSIAGDTIVTSLALPFISCLIVIGVTKWNVRGGRISPLPEPFDQHALAQWLPSTTWGRTFAFTLASGLLLAPATLATLAYLGVDAMPYHQFVIFKASWAVFDGACVSPLVAFLELARPALGRAEASIEP